jgi:8-oxo-dGTP pyrophosphatase MutT (NUDIX family)
MARAAGLLVRARDTGRFLFLLETDGQWNVPGGGIEGSERPKQAALREFVEETGFHGRLLIGARAADLDGFWLYGAEVAREFTPALSDEHVDYRWSELDEIPRPHYADLDLVVVRAEA